MEVYLDNSATTKCYDHVAELMVKVMTADYGNPSSMHLKGMAAEQHIRRTKAIIGKLLKVQEKEIYFTSGGTEADNLAVIGGALANRRNGNHIIASKIEHPAVAMAVKHLEELGFRISWIPVDHDGIVDLQVLEAELCDETVLVSVMQVNNEIGSVQPIEAIGKLIQRKNPKTLFHVDGVQGLGKYRIYPKRIGVHMYTGSGHKIHGPKGIGFLYIQDKVKVSPAVFGGGQQQDQRPGTENVPGIAGLGAAIEESYSGFEEKIERLYRLREQFIAGVEQLEGTVVNGRKDRESAPHVTSVSFRGVRSEVLLHALEDKGIYVSSGSACASNHPGISNTLKGIGVQEELLTTTLRFSMSEFTNEEEITYTLDCLGELLPVLRRYTRH